MTKVWFGFRPDERDCPIYKRKQEKQPRVEEINLNRPEETVRY